MTTPKQPSLEEAAQRVVNLRKVGLLMPTMSGVAAFSQACEELEAALAAPRSPEPPDEQVEWMVKRFLQWRLPENFNPDAGISFKPTFNENTSHPMKHEPIGTNLFTYTQAKEMVRYMMEGLTAAPSEPQADFRDSSLMVEQPAHNGQDSGSTPESPTALFVAQRKIALQRKQLSSLQQQYDSEVAYHDLTRRELRKYKACAPSEPQATPPARCTPLEIAEFYVGSDKPVAGSGNRVVEVNYEDYLTLVKHLRAQAGLFLDGKATDLEEKMREKTAKYEAADICQWKTRVEALAARIVARAYDNRYISGENVRAERKAVVRDILAELPILRSEIEGERYETIYGGENLHARHDPRCDAYSSKPCNCGLVLIHTLGLDNCSGCEAEAAPVEREAQQHSCADDLCDGHCDDPDCPKVKRLVKDCGIDKRWSVLKKISEKREAAASPSVPPESPDALIGRIVAKYVPLSINRNVAERMLREYEEERKKL